MANTKEIQKRMKSIRDTMKITSAMYMISSANCAVPSRSLSRRNLISMHFRVPFPDSCATFRRCRTAILTRRRKSRRKKSGVDIS